MEAFQVKITFSRDLLETIPARGNCHQHEDAINFIPDKIAKRIYFVYDRNTSCCNDVWTIYMCHIAEKLRLIRGPDI